MHPALIASLAAAWPAGLLAWSSLLLLAAVVGGPWSALGPAFLRALLGGLALAGFYLLLMIISPSGMSLGDVKLAASLGTLLAWFSWRLLIAGGFAGLCLGAIARRGAPGEPAGGQETPASRSAPL